MAKRHCLFEWSKAGWKVNFIRLHMDPYWSNQPGVSTTGENDISAFDFTRFKLYLDKVFIPMAEYAVSKGLYVVFRPPGVCPHEIAVGDAYQQYLIKVWTYVAQHSKLKNHPNMMFELANEPVNIQGPDGDFGADTQGHYNKLKEYFQAIVDAMRAEGCDNILWVPGLGYQGLYKGLAVNPIEGQNIGYAVHLYPGWLGSDGENGDGGYSQGGYEPFQRGWIENVVHVAAFAPIIITEMDWAPSKYNASWGKAQTGTLYGPGFGANMKHIVDQT
ncbi:MAG: glycoside hydrolase family 5 protein, partial [Endomicrobium sp.]|nr:glycoside hydrolase family 5 protein [Endomicrobium sp.]